MLQHPVCLKVGCCDLHSFAREKVKTCFDARAWTAVFFNWYCSKKPGEVLFGTHSSLSKLPREAQHTENHQNCCGGGYCSTHGTPSKKEQNHPLAICRALRDNPTPHPTYQWPLIGGCSDTNLVDTCSVQACPIATAPSGTLHVVSTTQLGAAGSRKTEYSDT